MMVFKIRRCSATKQVKKEVSRTRMGVDNIKGHRKAKDSEK